MTDPQPVPLSERIAALLREAGIENAVGEARWIAEDARDEKEALEWGKRRAAGEPLQYILGSVPFRHLELSVGPGAFIPRPETELVAGRAIELLPEDGIAVDVGTGAGPIALSLAHERRDATVFATEISEAALTWARRNLGELKVEFLLGPLFEPLPDHLRGTVDVVVSNPPYVSESEGDRLPRDVIDHEPYVALVSPDGGKRVISAIATEARVWLRPGGSLVLEIGETQGAWVEDLLRGSGYQDVNVNRDLAGKNRIAEGRAT